MTVITLDIETLADMRPGAREEFIEASRQDFKAPSDLTKEQALRDLGHDPAGEMKFKSKAEAIQMWCDAFGATKCEEVGETAWRKTAFDATRGQICVIGFSFDGEEPESLQIKEPEDEARILRTFFERLAIRYKATNMRRPIFVGHNLVNFDLPFIYRRAVILGIQPPAFLPINPSPYNEYVFDTMLQWAGSKGRISMQNLCEALGIPGKETDGDIDGSKVTDFYLNGQIDDVAKYCRGDIRRTRAMYDRLTFGKHSDAAPVDLPLGDADTLLASLDRDELLKIALGDNDQKWIGCSSEPPHMDLIAPGHSLEDLALPGAEAISPWLDVSKFATIWRALPAIENWVAVQHSRIRSHVERGNVVDLGNGEVLALVPTARRWKPEAEERLKSFAMKKDEMYHMTLIEPEEAEHFFSEVKPSKVRLERLKEVLEDDPNSVGLVAVKAESIAEVEAPAQVTEQPAAPVEEDIDNLF